MSSTSAPSSPVVPETIDDPPVRRRRKGKVDMDKAFGLYCRYRNYHEVARLMGVSPQSIQQGLRNYKTFLDTLPNVEQYRHDRIDILTAAESVAIRSCIDDRAIAKAPLAARSTNFGIIQQRRREEEGKGNASTVFHGVIVNIQREALNLTMKTISGPASIPDGEEDIDLTQTTHKDDDEQS